MAVYAVSYDLNKSGQDYEGIFKVLKEDLGGYMKYLDSTWLISTSLSAEQIHKALSPHIDKNDCVLVIEVKRNWSAQLPKDALEWLNDEVK